LTVDSDRRCSIKVVTKEKEVHKMVKYSLIFPAIPELKNQKSKASNGNGNNTVGDRSNSTESTTQIINN
jgi:hypothetical protein